VLLIVVFVVASDPQLQPVALVAAFRCPVEDRVVAHQELDPAGAGRIGLADGPSSRAKTLKPELSVR
jgi:hypothetical protein